jgi:hypothetical protein
MKCLSSPFNSEASIFYNDCVEIGFVMWKSGDRGLGPLIFVTAFAWSVHKHQSKEVTSHKAKDLGRQGLDSRFGASSCER